MKHFRIPQPKELNLCDYCYKTIDFIEGSIFLDKHYSFCTKRCKNNFLLETEEFLKGNSLNILYKLYTFSSKSFNIYLFASTFIDTMLLPQNKSTKALIFLGNNSIKPLLINFFLFPI